MIPWTEYRTPTTDYPGRKPARETSRTTAKSNQRFQWTLPQAPPTFSFVAGTGDRTGGDRPERVGSEPERATRTSDRAPPERGGTGLARGHRKRPSGWDRAEGQLDGRLRPDGERERSKGRLHRRDQPSGAETAGTRTPRGGESFLGVSRVWPTACAEYRVYGGAIRLHSPPWHGLKTHSPTTKS